MVGNNKKVRMNLNGDRLCVNDGMEIKITSISLIGNLLRARDIQTGQESTVLFEQGTRSMEVKI